MRKRQRDRQVSELKRGNKSEQVTQTKRGTEPQRPKERDPEPRVKEAETQKVDRDKRNRRD